MASNEDAPVVSTYRDYDPDAAAKAAKASVGTPAMVEKTPVKATDKKEI